MNADGSQLERIAATRPAGIPTWSPDSSRIAYASRTSYSGSPERIAVLGIDGSRPFRTEVSGLYGVIVGPIVWQPTDGP
jgi:Tol biopolymer transport system component